ncbi:MAG TPA: hypothetical protein VM324_09270 [Egibacteraceae bacterium]|nr:hypothetical protein [Egibacteraceae bacterium]
MSDFEDALRARLERNAELAREREDNVAAMARYEQDRAEEARREAQRLSDARRTRHAELVDALSAAAQGLKAASPESFIVRLGWTESGEEFIAKISTRLMEPARSLLIELDRDDDEVLARWHSDLGNALELWRLLDVDTSLLHDLVLQVADQELWQQQTRNPPPFPGARS